MTAVNEAANQKLIQAFRKGLSLPETQAVESLVYNSIKEWDSVAHMRLVAVIEEDFGIMLSTDDILDLSSFSKSKEILGKYLS